MYKNLILLIPLENSKLKSLNLLINKIRFLIFSDGQKMERALQKSQRRGSPDRWYGRKADRNWFAGANLQVSRLDAVPQNSRD